MDETEVAPIEIVAEPEAETPKMKEGPEKAEGVLKKVGSAAEWAAGTTKGGLVVAEGEAEAAEHLAKGVIPELTEMAEGDANAKLLKSFVGSGTAETAETVAKGVKGTGAALGLVGAGMAGYDAYEDIKKGDYAKGGLEGTEAALAGTAAVVEGAQAAGVASTALAGNAAALGLTEAELAAMGVSEGAAAVGGASGASLTSAGVLGPAAGALAAGIGGGIALEEATKSTGLFKDDQGKNEGGAEHFGRDWGTRFANWIDPSETKEDGSFHAGGTSTGAMIGGSMAAGLGAMTAGLAGDLFGGVEALAQFVGLDKKGEGLTEAH